MSENRPLVPVVEAKLFSGRGSVLGPSTDRRTCWWELILECGHEVERPGRYRSNGQSWNRTRNTEDVLPAPKRARCDRCIQW